MTEEFEEKPTYRKFNPIKKFGIFFGRLMIDATMPELIALEKRPDYLINHYRHSENDVLLACIIKGLPIIEAEAKGQAELPQKGTAEYEEWYNANTMYRQAEEDKKYAWYEEQLQRLGYDGFIAWAEAGALSGVQEFFQARSTRAPKIVDTTEHNRAWLTEYLTGKGFVPVKQIKQAALDAGIISELDGKEWSALEANARYHGFVGGKYGHWRLPENGKILKFAQA